MTARLFDRRAAIETMPRRRRWEATPETYRQQLAGEIQKLEPHSDCRVVDLLARLVVRAPQALRDLVEEENTCDT